MLISVLVPVYNTSKYLDRCMKSLLNQTYKDLEIVVINDGSTDDSLSKLEQYAKKDSRVKVYSYENAGISKTRNRALEQAHGEYITFVDSDDFIDHRMIEKLYQAAIKRDLDVVQCNFVMDYGPIPFYRKPTFRKDFSTLEAMKMLAKEFYLNNYPWGKLYKRECFDGVHFPENMKGFEDTCTIFKAIAKAKRVGTIPNRYYHYAQRFGSLTNCMSLETVYLMRRAYQYQEQEFNKLFKGEKFSFDLQHYNTDMVLIYTLILFVHRKDHAKFVPADFNWKKTPIPPFWYIAYWAWLGIAMLKLSPNILKMPKDVHDTLQKPPADLNLDTLFASDQTKTVKKQRQ